MLVPTIRSIGISFSSRTFRTPMWASPRAAPPPRASPTLNPSNIPAPFRQTCPCRFGPAGPQYRPGVSLGPSLDQPGVRSGSPAPAPRGVAALAAERAGGAARGTGLADLPPQADEIQV